MRSPVLLILLAGLMACGDKDDTHTTPGADDTAGTDGTDDTGGLEVSDTGICADAPVVTWENFGNGFVNERCQSCHASTSLARYGAPESITFDTKEETLALQDRILDRVVDSESMPPEGGVTDDDLELLQLWLVCWE